MPHHFPAFLFFALVLVILGALSLYRGIIRNEDQSLGLDGLWDCILGTGLLIIAFGVVIGGILASVFAR